MTGWGCTGAPRARWRRRHDRLLGDAITLGAAHRVVPAGGRGRAGRRCGAVGAWRCAGAAAQATRNCNRLAGWWWCGGGLGHGQRHHCVVHVHQEHLSGILRLGLHPSCHARAPPSRHALRVQVRRGEGVGLGDGRGSLSVRFTEKTGGALDGLLLLHRERVRRASRRLTEPAEEVPRRTQGVYTYTHSPHRERPRGSRSGWSRTVL
jgi:hypothetical protein